MQVRPCGIARCAYTANGGSLFQSCAAKCSYLIKMRIGCFKAIAVVHCHNVAISALGAREGGDTRGGGNNRGAPGRCQVQSLVNAAA